MTLDFWFDYSSPFAYLAAMRVEALAARHGAALRWQPMLLGAIFREVGQVDVPLYAMNPARQAWTRRDLVEQAEFHGIPFRFSPHFPLRTVLPLRVTLAMAEMGDPAPFIRRVFLATWAEGLDTSDPEVLRRLGAPEAVVRGADAWRRALYAQNEAAIAAGVFGTPSFVVDGRWLFWGGDRMDQVEACLSGWRPPA